MKLKFTWGTGIVLAIVSFVTFGIAVIVFSTSQSINFVTKDYYSQGVNYEQMLLKQKNTAELKGVFKIEDKNDEFQITFPEDFKTEKITGTIQMYYVTDFKQDKVVRIQLDTTLTQHIGTAELPKGRYLIKVDWTDGKNAYFYEHKTDFNKK